ncbi:hypothetical protein SAMN05421736_108176 [Evansella caseinilytica]|uniref:Uncharacterized protein n=1 Tax=Evansella caseinilytica TaxID=1503961 RepID=A0A1H3RLS1_9BACI|nr:hypothetical protein [Evansella caseinilytica]SDZ26637.1 hypothetical protein SAMN05421736_108176 [Evansella caseinilytica]
MFFKDSETKDTKASNNACWITFIFWGVILFVNSIFENVYNKALISNSLVILLLGLTVFFLSNFIFKKTRRT